MTTALPVIRVGDLDGVVFKASEPSCFCFVPLTSLKDTADGNCSVDDIAYVRSSWHERNCAFNILAEGFTLFPEPDGLIADWFLSPARAYVELLQRSYGGQIPVA